MTPTIADLSDLLVNPENIATSRTNATPKRQANQAPTRAAPHGRASVLTGDRHNARLLTGTHQTLPPSTQAFSTTRTLYRGIRDNPPAHIGTYGRCNVSLGCSWCAGFEKVSDIRPLVSALGGIGTSGSLVWVGGCRDRTGLSSIPAFL
jgi:hypothetical protein